MIKIVTCAVLFVLITPANSFTLNTSTAARFEQNEVIIKIANNCQRINTTSEELRNITMEATSRYWNRAVSSRLTLIVGGIETVSSDYYTEKMCTSTTAEGGCEPNSTIIVAGHILITCNEEATENFPNGDLNVFASTLPNNASGRTIYGAILMINDRTGNAFSKATLEQKIIVIAHELGHAIGLGHTDDRNTLMYYQLQDINRTALSWDDVNGLTYLYPISQPDLGTCGTIAPLGGDNGSGPTNFIILITALLMVVLIKNRGIKNGSQLRR